MLRPGGHDDNVSRADLLVLPCYRRETLSGGEEEDLVDGMDLSDIRKYS